MSIRDFIAALPKTDLHLHLVGSASVPTVLKLARRYPQAGIPVDADVLARFYTFTDFAHFIDVYHAVDQLVRSPEDVTNLVVGAARDAAASNVRWAELTVTANTHLLAGIDPAALKEALEAGREIAHREVGVRLGFIIDIAAESGLGGADATVGFLRDHAPAGTLAIGLAGLEQAAPRAMFARHVEQARDLGYRAVIHAGESTGPATIWSALRDLKADRIGHGISAVADPDLLTHLALTSVPLEVCPISNLRTNVVTRPADHPVAALLRAGVTVTLGTDDPGMFDTDLNREYEYVADLVGLGEDDLAEIARVGVRSSFAPEDVRRDLIAEINATLAGTYATNAAKLGPQPPLRGAFSPAAAFSARGELGSAEQGTSATMDCVFCRLIRDDTATWIARGPSTCAFAPLTPIAPGHTLVVPTAHVTDVFDAAPHVLAQSMALVRRVADAMRSALGAEGVNILNASGPSSEQSVPHLHFHVIPRWGDDNFSTWPASRSQHHVEGDSSSRLAAALAVERA